MRSAYVWAGAATAFLLALSATVLRGRTTSGSITVIVVAGDGSMAPQCAASITVQGTATGAITNIQGRAVIHGVSAGPHTLILTRIGFCATRVPVNVPEGGETAVTAWLCPTQDVVTIDNPADQVVGLVNARLPDAGTTKCKEHVQYAGTGFFFVPENAMTPTAADGTCNDAVWILSRDHAISFTDAPTYLTWTDAVGDQYDASRPTRRLRVPIHFWMHTTHDKVALTSNILGYVSQANSLFNDSMAGLKLVANNSGPDVDPTVTNADAITGGAAAIGSGCANVTKIKATPAIYDASRLNVYYVAAIAGADIGSAAGYTCTAEGGKNIIFIDDDNSLPHTLAHEVGHALGLDRPAWGHTDALTGFYQDAQPLNVMNLGAITPSYFSLGQVIRMNFSDSSWLNAVSATGSVRGQQAEELGSMRVMACGCPETDSTSLCPSLKKDIARPFSMISVPGTLLACRATAPASVSVACGATTAPLTANYFQNTTLAASGVAKWTSLDPSIATVTMTGTSLGHSTATIHGIHAGNVEVRAYGGGSYAPVAVTVTSTSTCPAA